jgi:hypothetical protein
LSAKTSSETRNTGYTKPVDPIDKSKDIPKLEKTLEPSKDVSGKEKVTSNAKPNVDPAKDRAIATEIADKMPLGLFKSTDCRDVVKNIYPDHPLANGTSGAVGQRFVKYIDRAQPQPTSAPVRNN